MTNNPDSDPLAPLRQGDDGWLHLVREADAPRAARSIGDYDVVDEVRGGGQGLVFRARERSTGREVALKRLAGGAFATAVERRRFEREIDAVLSLQHPGIVTVYGTEDVDGSTVLAMEWVQGSHSPIGARASAAEATDWSSGCGCCCRCVTRSSTRISAA